MSSGDVHIPQWSIIDGYIGSRENPPQYTILSKDISALLQNQALLPIRQKSLSEFWCTTPPKREEIYQMLMKV